MPRAYLGLSVPGFPNMFLLYGPNTNGGSGSVVNTIEAGVNHVIAALRELDRAQARRIEVSTAAAEALRPRAARRARRDGLALGLHQLVRRRERQRPQPVAVAVDHLPAPHRAARAGHLRAGRLKQLGLIVHPTRPLEAVLDAIAGWASDHGVEVGQVRVDGQTRVVADARRARRLRAAGRGRRRRDDARRPARGRGPARGPCSGSRAGASAP